VDASVK
jgi:triosephosphate isomerase